MAWILLVLLFGTWWLLLRRRGAGSTRPMPTSEPGSGVSRAGLPLHPEHSLDPACSQLADQQLGDLLEQTWRDPAYDRRHCQALHQLLRVHFWQGFWRLTRSDDPAAQGALEAAEAALWPLVGPVDTQLLETARRRGQQHVQAWAGPDWHP